MDPAYLVVVVLEESVGESDSFLDLARARLALVHVVYLCRVLGVQTGVFIACLVLLAELLIVQISSLSPANRMMGWKRFVNAQLSWSLTTVLL
jgi:hypothetical protein